MILFFIFTAASKKFFAKVDKVTAEQPFCYLFCELT